MAKKVPGWVRTLSGFLKWAEQFNDGQYLFRGVPDKQYKIEAAACRRLPEPDRNNSIKLLKINQELIEKSRLLGHDQLGGERLSDLALLAELQHFRAATCLIDFTRNAFVALWFACEQISTTESEGIVEETDGKVYAVRIDDPARFKTITSKLLNENIKLFFEEDDNGRYPLYQWQPKLQNNRIIAQQSVFIFGGAKIEPEDECIISRSDKQDLLRALDKLAGITDATIYPDSDGFARLHVHNNPDFEPDPQGYLQRGVEAHQKNEREEAITYYTTVISPPPDDNAQPPDKDILSWAHHHRGIAYLGEDISESAVDLAIDDFTKTIQLKTELIESVTENPARVRRLKKGLARTYVHRGIAHYGKGEFDRAIVDFTEAIKLESEHADAYNHRGNAYFNTRVFHKAITDFSDAIRLDPDTRKYKDRGFAYLSNGDIEKAIADFNNAIQLDPDNTSNYSDRGFAYLSNGNFNNAIDDFTRTIQLDPNNTSNYNNRGFAYLSNDDFNNAIDDFTRTIQLDPKNGITYYNRGIVWLRSQNWEEAKTDLTTAKSNRLDIAAKFQQDYGTVEDFEQKTDVELPNGIAAILAP